MPKTKKAILEAAGYVPRTGRPAAFDGRGYRITVLLPADVVEKMPRPWSESIRKIVMDNTNPQPRADADEPRE